MTRRKTWRKCQKKVRKITERCCADKTAVEQTKRAVELTVRPVHPADLSAVLAVVVHKHVLADAEKGCGVHHEGRADSHLYSKRVRTLLDMLMACHTNLLFFDKNAGLTSSYRSSR